MWEKTVMSDEQIERQFAIDRSWYGDTEWEFYHELLQAQAEITGEIAYKEGIKKVVEFIESKRMYRYAKIGGGRKEDTYDCWIRGEDLDAFKKGAGL